MKFAGSRREKWFAFLKGEDVGPMVSPLCSDWNFDRPYRWPYPGTAEPYSRDVFEWQLTEQIALAGLLDWEPRFMIGLPFEPSDPGVRCRAETEPFEKGTRTRSVISTPYGDLTRILTKKASEHVEKEWLETGEDFKKAIWVMEKRLKTDTDRTVAAGRQLQKAVGDKGIIGVFSGPPVAAFLNKPQMFYHMADFPDLFGELHRLTFMETMDQLPVLRDAGMDFLFYVVDGTEWISPDFFERYILENSLKIFDRWRSLGGFILLHSCGRLKCFLEKGYYNRLLPEIMETFTLPPEGDLPDLGWARERLDRRIATMGNLPLSMLRDGTPGMIRQGVASIREQTKGYRHVFGLSDAIIAGTKWENMEAFIAEASRQA